MIPNQLIYDENIGNEAKVLFCYIRSLSENYRNLRNSNLCQKLGCSVNTLQKAKKELIDNGYLVINRLSSPKFGQYYKSNNINNNNNSNKGFKKFKKFKD